MSTMTPDPIGRFTGRAENYARYRPGYPAAVLDCLREEFGLTPDAIVADVGSGTGILTGLFLRNGNRVYAVEPNDAMRRMAEESLAGRPGFVSINGRAEATTLPDAAVDFIVVGQAFHWFEPVAAGWEFRRILRPGGPVVLVWNTRRPDGGFMDDYDVWLDSLRAKRVGHTEETDIATFFGGRVERRAFPNEVVRDWDSVQGGFLSASYAPRPDDPDYEPAIAHLRALFDRYQRDGAVTFPYETEVYVGRL